MGSLSSEDVLEWNEKLARRERMDMPSWVWWAAGTAVAVLLSQVWVITAEFLDRRRKFRQAKAFAASVGKPLLVVGRPGNNRIKVYTGGDVTIDVDPGVLEDCPEGGCVADVRSIPFPDGRFGAAFVSFVLDYLPSVAEFETSLAELSRVADRVFVCHTRTLNIRWRYLPIPDSVNLWISEKQGKLRARVRLW
ncbi:MAG: methyltransferase domain-containing protein [Chloroflexi bacterium]|nr:methyltransferase domain-containing protein [Chloroflexota bacterium]